MKLPPKDDPHGDKEGALPLADVLTVLRRHDVSVTHDSPERGGPYTLADDETVEVQFLTDPVGGLMVRYLARKFGVPIEDFYFFRQIDEQKKRPPIH